MLFTDIEGSTRLLQELGREDYVRALTEHRQLLREAFTARGGVEVEVQGDSFLFAFDSPQAASAAAESAQRALAEHNWESDPIRVRIGVHTGEPVAVDGLYTGLDVHRAARIMSAAHGGQVLLSQTTRDFLDEAVEVRDLGEHRLKDLSAPQRLYQLGDGEFPPLKSLNQTNLPVQPTPLIGRERELGGVLELMRSSRLLTLTGAGGSGKTRLALHAAAQLTDDFADGVWFVSLAPIADPDLVLQTVSSTLGVRGDLAEFVRHKQLLLLLDNVEQLLPGAAPSIAGLLAAEGVKLLATSRERLGLSAEQEYIVPTLPLGDAVALFTARARQLKPTFEPDEHVDRIAAELDGLPLALELAASRVKVLTPQQIVERLGQSLELLASGNRDAPERQRTLEATIDWSYGLLSTEEQQLFVRLAVFVGGFDLKAAEVVCDAELDTLQSLIDKSLLRQTGEGRFFMLQTIREFAARRLTEGGEEEEMRRRHRGHFVAIAEAEFEVLYGIRDGQRAALARFALEHANVRAAVSHAFEAGEPDDVGRLIGCLTPLFITHGYLAEATEWLDAALRARDRLSKRGLLRLLLGGGEIARFGGDLGRAIELKEALLVLERDDSERSGWHPATLADLSDIAMDKRDFERAHVYLEESIAAGRHPRAAISLAELALREGDLKSAEAFCVEALAGLHEGEFNYACVREIQGETARRLGDGSEARRSFSAGLQLFSELGDGGGAADCLDGLARIATDADDAERAGRLVGAAKGLRETWGRRPARTDVPTPDAPEAAHAEGMSMTLEEAVAYALDQSNA
jgi:predicted ATPase